MNKLTFTSLFTGLILSSQLYAANEIKITGNVLDSTCVLAPTNTGDSNGNITVILDNVLAQNFTDSNPEQGFKEFTLKLANANGSPCDELTAAQITGMTLTANSPLVGSTGIAQNEAYLGNNPVNIMIKNKNVPVDVTGYTPVAPERDDNLIPTFTYQASYIASDVNSVVSQPVVATLTYSLTYN